MTDFDQAMLADLLHQAKMSPRLRAHRLLHEGHGDQVQRLVVGLQRGTYFRPHRHPEQWELMALLQGRMDYLLFDADGRVTERIAMSKGASVLVQLPQEVIHAVAVMEDDTLAVEVKAGPFRPAEFESWAPEEGATDAPRFVEWAEKAQTGARWNS